jgi:hypothetical protein
VDQTLDEARAAVNSHQWPWQFGFVGPGTSGPAARRYEVQSTPELFLIDIDGVILYRGPVRTVDSLKTRIQQRLAQLPAELPPPHETIKRIQPIPIDDDFTPNSPVAIVLAGNNVQYQPDTGPTLQGPGLMLWSADGTLVRQLDDIGTSGWLSGPRRMAFDPKNNRIYFCDTSKDQLVALDGFGRKLFASSVPDLHAVAVDEVTGDVWCLTVTQLNQGELVVLDSDGREKNRAPITGFDLAFSPADDAFWIAGSSITKINREGEVFSSQPLPDGGFTFANVAVDRERGGAWVLELGHPDRDHSQNQLWKVAPDGAAMATHTFANTDYPRSLASVDGKPWLAVLKNYSRSSGDSPEYELRVFNEAGEFERAVPVSASSVAADSEATNVWVRVSDHLLQLDDQGQQLRRIELLKDWNCVMVLVTGK